MSISGVVQSFGLSLYKGTENLAVLEKLQFWKYQFEKVEWTRI